MSEIYANNKRRTVFGKDDINIPSVELFGYSNFLKATTPLETHLHMNCMEFVFVFKGEQIYYVDEKIYSLTGNNAFIALKNQKHSTGGNSQGLGEFYWFQINVSDKDNFLCYNEVMSKTIVEQLLEINKNTFIINDEIRSQLKFILEELIENPTSPLIASAFMHMLNLVISCVNKENDNDNKLSAIDLYIDNNIYTEISIDDLCSACGFSQSTLHHSFKKNFGMTAGAYINYRKITKAKQLLSNGENVTKTAMLLAYGSSAYFATVFKKFVGISPTQWKKENKNK